MYNQDDRQISVIDPINRAMDRAIGMTFRPFDIGKWFVLGFITWLSLLGDGGGSNLRLPDFGGGGAPPAPGPGAGMPGPGGLPPRPPNPAELIWAWMTTHVLETTLIVIGIVLLLTGIWLLVQWISSRAKFMLLHAVATNTYEVAAPWKSFKPLGNSLLGFRVCLALIGWIVLLLAAGICLWIAWPDIQARQFEDRALLAVVLGFLMMVPTGIALAIIGWCTTAFVAPIMYARGLYVMDAWREFRQRVVSGHVGSLILFLLMNIALAIVVLIGQIIVGCGTCCIGFLPYLSTVFTLPLILFMRCYSIYYIQQFAPEYVIIQEPPPSYGFPVIGIPYPPPEAPQGPYQPPPSPPLSG